MTAAFYDTVQGAQKARDEKRLIGRTLMLIDDSMAVCCFLEVFKRRTVLDSLSESKFHVTQPSQRE